jgi:hypothetical protein
MVLVQHRFCNVDLLSTEWSAMQPSKVTQEVTKRAPPLIGFLLNPLKLLDLSSPPGQGSHAHHYQGQLLTCVLYLYASVGL